MIVSNNKLMRYETIVVNLKHWFDFTITDVMESM